MNHKRTRRALSPDLAFGAVQLASAAAAVYGAFAVFGTAWTWLGLGTIGLVMTTWVEARGARRGKSDGE